MTVELSTLLDASPERVWEEVRRPALLAYVAHPVLAFEPVDPPAFPERWEAGEYRVRTRLFGVVPLGWQVVGIELPATPGGVRRVRDNGRGALVRRWDHLITIAPAGPGRTRYTDRVHMGAGPLTPLVWAFARAFYAHRQRRWRRLVERGSGTTARRRRCDPALEGGGTPFAVSPPPDASNRPAACWG